MNIISTIELKITNPVYYFTHNMKKTILFLTINIIFLATNYSLAQTCQDYIPNEWEYSRYTNHSNGTVTDNQTNLMWKKCVQSLSGGDCSIGTHSLHNWQEALQLVSNHSFASYNDWRLPNIKKLSSLTSDHCHTPSINESIFPNTLANYFWSSLPSMDGIDASWAWVLSFRSGEDGTDGRNSDHYVRLVRSGQ